MKLAVVTWPEVDAFDRAGVVLIPTGSCEQHGHHLPMFTDSLLVTAVAEACEVRLGAKVLLTPTIWLGASMHHLGFAGSLSASYSGYVESVFSVADSLSRHGFWKFLIVNGHGGNESLNDVVSRQIKDAQPNALVGQIGYFRFIEREIAEIMTGPSKAIQHACEAETSLMLHVAPEHVREDRAVDGGLNPPVAGMTHTFAERTEAGSLGYPTLASAAKGRRLFDGAVNGLCEMVETLAGPYTLS